LREKGAKVDIAYLRELGGQKLEGEAKRKKRHAGDVF